MISIIVPVYNIENYIQDCIQSISAQSYNDWELLLIDDGSTDKSGIICDGAAKFDKLIKVFPTKNLGAYKARAYGINLANGEWLTFVDGDDTLPADSLELLLNSNTNSQYDIIAGTLNLNNKQIFRHQISGDITSTNYIEAILLNKTSIGLTAKLFKRDIINQPSSIKIDKDIFQNEDLLKLLETTIKSDSILIRNDIIIYNYRYRFDSISKSQKMSIESWFNAFNIIQEIIRPIETTAIQKAFLIYRLRRLYDCVILKGIKFDTRNPVIQNIIQKAHKYRLESNETNIICLLKSSYRRNYIYFKKQTIAKVKHIIKSLLNI